MVEEVERLRLHAELNVLAQSKPLRQIKITPHEIGTTQRVPA
jgi:hypothetical protein